MSFKNVRETYWAPCTCGSDRPCSKHPEKPSEGNNLFTLEELDGVRFAEVSIVANQLLTALRDAQKPEHPKNCGTCVHAIRESERTLKRLGVLRD